MNLSVDAGQNPLPVRMRRSPFLACIAVSAACWLLLFAIFPPSRQNFPLWDDFSFSQSAFLFAHGKGIHYLHWASMPQLGQWLWTAPFIWCFGDTQAALRVATITLSWVGLWGLYDLLRQQGFTPGKAAVAVTALALNPYFFIFQGTAMTDVPALSLGLIALALYNRAVTQARTTTMLAAAAVALLAVTTRQNMTAVPIVAALLLWRSPQLRWRPLCILSVVGPVAVGFATHLWFHARPDIRRFNPHWPGTDEALVMPFLILHFTGLASLPVLALNPWPRSPKRFLLALVFMLGCAGYWYVYTLRLPYGGLYPYWGDAISPWGVYREFTAGLPPQVLGFTTRLLITLAGCVGGAALLTRLVPWLVGDRPAGPLLLFGLLQIPLLLLVPTFIDRYLLVLVPTGLFLAGQRESAPGRLPSFAAALALGVFAFASVCLDHDLFSMTAARWRLGQRAIARWKIDPWELEGGFNWDGWHTPDPKPTAAAQRGYRPRLCVGWFPQISGEYALSFSEYEDAQVLDSERYTLWFPPQRSKMLLLKQPPLKRGEPHEAPAVDMLVYHLLPGMEIDTSEDPPEESTDEGTGTKIQRPAHGR